MRPLAGKADDVRPICQGHLRDPDFDQNSFLVLVLAFASAMGSRAVGQHILHNFLSAPALACTLPLYRFCFDSAYGCQLTEFLSSQIFFVGTEIFFVPTTTTLGPAGQDIAQVPGDIFSSAGTIKKPFFCSIDIFIAAISPKRKVAESFALQFFFDLLHIGGMGFNRSLLPGYGDFVSLLSCGLDKIIHMGYSSHATT